MPPIRTSSLSEPSCSIALVYRSVTCPSRDRAKFRAVNTSAARANSPAPNVSSLPRAASRAVWRRNIRNDPVTWPTSWVASQSAAGTKSAQAATANTATTRTPITHPLLRAQALAASDPVLMSLTVAAPYGEEVSRRAGAVPGGPTRGVGCQARRGNLSRADPAARVSRLDPAVPGEYAPNEYANPPTVPATRWSGLARPAIQHRSRRGLRGGNTRQRACASALPGIGGEVADCRLRAHELAPDHPLLLDPSDHEYPGRLLRPVSSDIDDQEMRVICLIQLCQERSRARTNRAWP